MPSTDEGSVSHKAEREGEVAVKKSMRDLNAAQRLAAYPREGEVVRKAIEKFTNDLNTAQHRAKPELKAMRPQPTVTAEQLTQFTKDLNAEQLTQFTKDLNKLTNDLNTAQHRAKSELRQPQRARGLRGAVTAPTVTVTPPPDAPRPARAAEDVNIVQPTVNTKRPSKTIPVVPVAKPSTRDVGTETTETITPNVIAQVAPTTPATAQSPMTAAATPGAEVGTDTTIPPIAPPGATPPTEGAPAREAETGAISDINQPEPVISGAIPGVEGAVAQPIIAPRAERASDQQRLDTQAELDGLRQARPVQRGVNALGATAIGEPEPTMEGATTTIPTTTPQAVGTETTPNVVQPTTTAEQPPQPTAPEPLQPVVATTSAPETTPTQPPLTNAGVTEPQQGAGVTAATRATGIEESNLPKADRDAIIQGVRERGSTVRDMAAQFEGQGERMTQPTAGVGIGAEVGTDTTIPPIAPPGATPPTEGAPAREAETGAISDINQPEPVISGAIPGVEGAETTGLIEPEIGYEGTARGDIEADAVSAISTPLDETRRSFGRLMETTDALEALRAEGYLPRLQEDAPDYEEEDIGLMPEGTISEHSSTTNPDAQLVNATDIGTETSAPEDTLSTEGLPTAEQGTQIGDTSTHELEFTGASQESPVIAQNVAPTKITTNAENIEQPTSVARDARVSSLSDDVLLKQLTDNKVLIKSDPPDRRLADSDKGFGEEFRPISFDEAKRTCQAVRNKEGGVDFKTDDPNLTVDVRSLTQTGGLDVQHNVTTPGDPGSTIGVTKSADGKITYETREGEAEIGVKRGGKTLDVLVKKGEPPELRNVPADFNFEKYGSEVSFSYKNEKGETVTTDLKQLHEQSLARETQMVESPTTPTEEPTTPTKTSEQTQSLQAKPVMGLDRTIKRSTTTSKEMQSLMAELRESGAAEPNPEVMRVASSPEGERVIGNLTRGLESKPQPQIEAMQAVQQVKTSGRGQG